MYLLTTSVVVCIILTANIEANELTKSISSFASEFYQQCGKSKPGDNIIISPLSVANALALLSQGAGANTYEELKRGLQLSGNKTSVANQFQEYYGLLERSVGQSTLSIANKIYAQEGQQINKQFHDVAVDKFRSGIQSLNFANSADSVRTINQFVEEKTNNKIKDLIKPDMISSDTRVVLVNAIYFKGTWEYKFEKESTSEGKFYISDTETRPVDFMHMETNLNYAPLPDLHATALELKYANSNFSMVIILPNSRTGLPELEEKMKNKDLTSIVDQMYKQAIEIWIPKFTIDFEINLNDVLKNMGMAEMFTPKADLSGLLEGNAPLYVSDVVHKAFIEVNEEGSEAAAATAGGIVLYSAFGDEFRANHPFMYFIRETQQNSVIFSGRVVKLSKT